MNTLIFLLLMVLVCGGLISGCSNSDQYRSQRTTPVASSTSDGDTVKEIVARPVDDMMVNLRGKIMGRIEDDDYHFTDGTGNIIVEIEDEDWPGGQPLAPGTHVEIIGEVEKKDRGRAKIEVKRIRVISP